jgi:hypothetical protein
VVGHGDRGLAERGHPVNELMNAASPIQQRVLGMQMQMCKFTHGNSDFSHKAASAPCPKTGRNSTCLKKTGKFGKK